MSSQDEQYDAALDLLRRVNPRDVSKNLNILCQQNQDLAEELLSSVDQPLKVETDPTNQKQFLCCDYNRDGDSYRSPYSNKFFPELDDAIELPAEIRSLEETANDAFDTYRELYYEGGLSSCYLWESEEPTSLAGVVLFQKHQKQSRWDSINVFEAEQESKNRYTYRLTSTVILDIGMKLTNLAGSLTRQAERSFNIESKVDHVANVGTMVEEMESKLRSLLHEVYFGKTRNIIGDIRSVDNLDDVRSEMELKRAVANSL